MSKILYHYEYAKALAMSDAIYHRYGEREWNEIMKIVQKKIDNDSV